MDPKTLSDSQKLDFLVSAAAALLKGQAKLEERVTEVLASSGPTTATAAQMQAAPTAPIAGNFYKMAGIA